MRKCIVIADRLSLVVGKDSTVYVDDRQFELAKKFLKPLDNSVKESTRAKDPIDEAKGEETVEKKTKSRKNSK